MNPKGIGEISEGLVIAHLLKAGHSVSIPFGNNQRYDLILDDRQGLHRVQVKTGRIVNGCVTFATASRNSLTGARSDYRGQADLFMVYCPANDSIYRVPVADCGLREARLRIQPALGGSKSNVRWAADYLG